jgi:hypothetical protein
VLGEIDHQTVALLVRVRHSREQVWGGKGRNAWPGHRGIGHRSIGTDRPGELPLELGRSEERVGIEPADERMRCDAQPFDERAEDVLPAEETVREEVQATVFLQLDEGRKVIGEGAIDCLSSDAAAIESARGRDDLLGPRIEAVLIGKDVDLVSL